MLHRHQRACPTEAPAEDADRVVLNSSGHDEIDCSKHIPLLAQSIATACRRGEAMTSQVEQQQAVATLPKTLRQIQHACPVLVATMDENDSRRLVFLLDPPALESEAVIRSRGKLTDS